MFDKALEPLLVEDLGLKTHHKTWEGENYIKIIIKMMEIMNWVHDEPNGAYRDEHKFVTWLRTEKNKLKHYNSHNLLYISLHYPYFFLLSSSYFFLFILSSFFLVFKISIYVPIPLSVKYYHHQAWRHCEEPSPASMNHHIDSSRHPPTTTKSLSNMQQSQVSSRHPFCWAWHVFLKLIEPTGITHQLRYPNLTKSKLQTFDCDSTFAMVNFQWFMHF